MRVRRFLSPACTTGFSGSGRGHSASPHGSPTSAFDKEDDIKSDRDRLTKEELRERLLEIAREALLASKALCGVVEQMDVTREDPTPLEAVNDAVSRIERRLVAIAGGQTLDGPHWPAEYEPDDGDGEPEDDGPDDEIHPDEPDEGGNEPEASQRGPFGCSPAMRWRASSPCCLRLADLHQG